MRTAPAIANLLFFPMMFLSGSAMPFAFLPDGVKRFARLLPTTYLVDTYSSVIVRGEGLLADRRIARRAARHRRRRHRADLDAVPMGRHRSDSAQGAGHHRRRVCAPRSAWRRSPRRRSAWATCQARGASSPATPRDRCACCAARRSSTALGGRIVNARVVIRDHRIAEVSLDDERVPLPEGAVVEDLRGRYLIPGLVRFARALGRLRRHRRGADRADRRSDGARLRRHARSGRDLGGVADRRPREHAIAVGRRGGGPSSARRARSSPARRSPRRAGIRRRCSRSCRGWPSS